MITRTITTAILLLLLAQNVRADIPWEGPGPRPPRKGPWSYWPAPEVPRPSKLKVVRDTTITTAQLILPRDLLAAPTGAPRLGATMSNTLAGVALAGSLITGGLWFARGRASKKHLLATASILTLIGSLALVGAASADVIPFPPPPNPPPPVDLPKPPPADKLLSAPVPARVTTERGKIRISREAGSSIQLILPKRVPADGS